MPWPEWNLMDQRTEFALRALAGRESMSELCQEFGISRKTGYKWRERFLREGCGGMGDLSRRPRSSPQSLSEEVVCRIVRLRQEHPHWGARKLMELWRRAWTEPVPSESSFKRVLEKAGMVKRRRPRPSSQGGRLQLRRQASSPNEVWTIDFKGWWPATGGGRSEPLTVRDGFSRFILCARALDNGGGQAVRAELERVFRAYGLPEVIRSDNGVPFASASSPLGLSRLSAWWVVLGISLDRIDPGRPDQNGGHERMHRDIAREVQACSRGSLQEVRAALEIWRRSFNEERPHEALGMKCPSEVYTASPRRYDGTPDDIEYGGEYLPRRVHKTGTIRIEGRQILISKALGGWSVGLKPYNEKELGVWFGPLLIGDLDLETESFAAARTPRQDPTLDPSE
jgi:putative transposase